jgi:hypothetical protein
MVATAAVPTPIPKPNKVAAFVDKDTGVLNDHGVTLLSQWHAQMVGTSRLIPCEATGQNLITLTPLAPSPLLEKYAAFDTFQFVAAQTSNGVVTATVVPKSGTLATLKVFKSNGATQATTGDVVANSYYTLAYVDTLDSGNGGLVLK